MNASGISVFYGAMDPETCIAEARAPVGSYVILGRFELIKPVRLLDLDALTQIITKESWFHPEFTMRTSRAAFLAQLVREISRPIMPRDEEFEYLPTQAVAEYLASCVEPPLDGIVFHSAQTDGKGRNIVLFHHASRVEPHKLPDGGSIEVDMGWVADDDYDSTITITECHPAKKTKQKMPPDEDRKWPFFSRLPDLGPPSMTDEDYAANRVPTLKLDIKNINLFRITGVTYGRTERSVICSTRTKDKREDS